MGKGREEGEAVGERQYGVDREEQEGEGVREEERERRAEMSNRVCA